MIPTAAGGDSAVPFKSPTGSISQPATISSIQGEVPRDRSAVTNIRKGDRENFHNGLFAGSEQSEKECGEIT